MLRKTAIAYRAPNPWTKTFTLDWRKVAGIVLLSLNLGTAPSQAALNLFGSSPKLLAIKEPVGISRRISEPWAVLTDSRDPEAEQIVQRYLQSLKALGLNTDEQGVWVQSGLFLLAEHKGQTPLPAASLTKIATSLAALETWGPNHQFPTNFSTNGTVQNGVLQGDLIVEGTGDPMFVWEEAIAVGNALNQLGITQVTGDLVITGNFAMNFEWDPLKSGNLLKQGMNAAAWDDGLKAQMAKLQPQPPAPRVVINGGVKLASPVQAKLIMQHQSLPLWNIVKRLNVYSNNFMAEMLSRLLGGQDKVMQAAAKAAGVPPQEIRLVNGSGLGVENKISPHAAVSMFAALQRYAGGQNLTIADLFPIAGTDVGTIEDREIPRNAVVKTGTLNDVSALAGVIPTQTHGLVTFTLINRGTNLDGLRASQDVFLQQIQRQWGSPNQRLAEISPLAPVADERIKLGSQQRNQAPATGG
jgi:serine-type D-Ala-D-Ala carboxypeptidase/endopeptidase (penicillin-binding protein 4)